MRRNKVVLKKRFISVPKDSNVPCHHINCLVPASCCSLTVAFVPGYCVSNKGKSATLRRRWYTRNYMADSRDAGRPSLYGQAPGPQRIKFN